MDKRDLAVLERIFAEEVEHAIQGESPKIPTALKPSNKRVLRLAAEGYIEPDTTTLKGRGFNITMKGWRLTSLGHATYCFSCAGEGR